MSCTIQLKTKDFLEERGVINTNNQVLDQGEFRVYNKKLTELAFNKYNVGNPGQSLFNIEDGKVVTNDRLFNLLDEATFSHDFTKIFKNDKGISDTIGDIETDIFSLEETKTNAETITNNKSNKVLFGNSKSVSLTATDVFTNILDNADELTGESNQQLLESVRTLLNKSKAKVKFVEELKTSETMMQYNSRTNTIEMNLNALNKATPESLVVAFLHEAVHSISVNIYNESGTVNAQIFRANLDSLYSIYMKNPVDGLTFDNPLEFLAEAFANPILRQAIINNEVSTLNMWGQIVAAIRRILGLPNIFDAKINEIISKGDTFQSTSTEFPTLWERKKDAFEEASTDLRTLEQRFQRTISRLDENMNQNINRLKEMLKNKSLDENTIKNVEDRVSLLNSLRDELSSSAKNHTAIGIVSYINNMRNVLLYVESKMSSIDIEKEVDKALFLLTQHDNYLTTFSVIQELQNLLSEFQDDSTQEIFTTGQLEKLQEQLDSHVGKFNRLQGKMVGFKKKVMTVKLNDIRYFPQVIYKYRQKLAKEHKTLNLPGDKATYVNENIGVNGKEWENIKEDVKNEVDKMMKNPIFDIKGVDKTFTSLSNISNNLVQVMHKKLVELDNRRLEIERVEDLRSIKIFEDLKADKGTINVNTLYENITDTTKDGKKYLKGKYSVRFLDEFVNKIKEAYDTLSPKIDEKWAALEKLKAEVGNTSEYAKAHKAYKKLVAERDIVINKLRNDNLNFDKDGKATPKDKFLNNLDNLSEAEKNALEYYTEIIDAGNDVVWNSDTLKKYEYGAYFLELPKISKSTLERIYQGDVVGSLKEKWDYLVETRADDTEYTNEDIDLAGNKHRQLRLHYRDRGNFKNSLQSMDLANVFRMEFKNINIFKLRKEKEMELSFLIDIAKSQEFYTKNGSYLQRAAGMSKLSITQNEHSNLVEMLTNIMEYRFYDISNSVDQKFGKIDANKAVGYVNAATAFMALSLNFASGTANVVNANAQMFLETFIKGRTFNAKGLAKANKIYGQTLGDSLKDNMRGINRSYTNQLSEIFNIQGLFNLSDSNFLQASFLKKGASLKSLQVFQDSGEHWIQSTLTMAILDNIKVMNKDNKFIDIDGKVVKTISQAASLLDMHKVDKESGMVDLDPAVVYTTHSPNLEWRDGGKEMVDILIRKKLDDTIGNYTQTQQAEVMRHYGGRWVMLFRKYFVPMGQARLLGIGSSHIAKDKLREDQIRFSHALQEYEEGTYTTLIRYGYSSLKTFKKEILTRELWNDLSDYEKHNIKRAVTELVLTTTILPQLIQLSAMGATAMEDEDEQRMYFIMYQMRRLITELSAYRSLSESFKMLKSPIPSARFIESAMDVLENLYPANWFQEDSKGNNRLIKSVNQFNPWRQFGKDFERTFNFQNSTIVPR